jgi:hypoxanthine phosphoribosyltransferase
MKFAVMDWNYAERLGRKVAMQVLEDSFRPEKIIALWNLVGNISALVLNFENSRDEKGCRKMSRL